MAKKLSILEQAKKHIEETKGTSIIKFRDIRIDGGTQNRVVMQENVINEYAEAMLQENSNFPPIVLYKDDENNFWLADGFHRLEAMKLNGLKESECIISKGTIRDAILYSLSANATHGLRRTNEDKRKAVMILLEDKEWQRYSAEKLSDLAGVSAMTVGRIKKELGLNTNEIIGKDGRSYNLETSQTMLESKDLQSEIKERTKYYRLKLDNSYKDRMKAVSGLARLDEKVLFNEAVEYLENKYNPQKKEVEEEENSIFTKYK